MGKTAERYLVSGKCLSDSGDVPPIACVVLNDDYVFLDDEVHRLREWNEKLVNMCNFITEGMPTKDQLKAKVLGDEVYLWLRKLADGL